MSLPVWNQFWPHQFSSGRPEGLWLKGVLHIFISGKLWLMTFTALPQKTIKKMVTTSTAINCWPSRSVLAGIRHLKVKYAIKIVSFSSHQYFVRARDPMRWPCGVDLWQIRSENIDWTDHRPPLDKRERRKESNKLSQLWRREREMEIPNHIRCHHCPQTSLQTEGLH